MFILYEPILRFLSGPYREITRGDAVCGGNADQGCDLIVTGPLEPFMVRMKIAGYGGLALAVPIVFWQIWRFVTPALHRNERRYGLAFGAAAVDPECVAAVEHTARLLESLGHSVEDAAPAGLDDNRRL